MNGGMKAKNGGKSFWLSFNFTNTEPDCVCVSLRQRQPAMPQCVNYVNWSLGALMGARKLPKHTHTHMCARTHTRSSAVKWGNWREIRASEKGKLSLELYQKSDRVEVFLWRPENLANVRGGGGFHVLSSHLNRYQ